MKFTCTRANLLKALQLFSHVLDKRTADHHALHYAIGISTHQDHLRLHATTHDVHHSLSIPATIARTGRTILPFDVIFDFLKALRQKTLTVSIKTKKETIHLETGSSRLSLPTISSDWTLLAPPPPDGSAPHLTLPSHVLASLFHPVLSAVAKENGRYRLQAVHVQILPTATPTLTAVGTDGQRLTRMTHQTGSWVTKANQPLTALLSKRTARLLVEIAQEFSDETSISLILTNPTWIFGFPNGEVRTQNLPGMFPDYTRSIPAQESPTIACSRTSLISALRRMETISDPLSHPITIQTNESEILLSTVNAYIGEAHEPVEATVQTDGMTVGVNGKLLLEGLGTIEAENIHWSMASPEAPCVITTPDNPHWTHVLMPIRMS
ncbi:MAG: DNA polymerase III subunit beta [Nitrospirales bacterium]|nr:MAG: DNA polymerase III subunit beta [Nitrospirales bacterium]